MDNKVKRKHQFNIRKVPLKRFIPQKSPQLYALDVHSIGLPNRNKKIISWVSVNCDLVQPFDEDFNDQILYSQAYKQLYNKYLAIKENHQKQKIKIESEIAKTDQILEQQNQSKKRLVGIRDNLYGQIEQLRQKLTQNRDKNYNLRWEVYHQRGAHYVNVNGYSFFQNQEMSYEELLQMEEQIGNVSKGLTQEEIDTLPTQHFKGTQQPQQEICCICFDEVLQGEVVTVLRCKHTHHCDCLKDWLLKQKNCPICKQEIIATNQMTVSQVVK